MDSRLGYAGKEWQSKWALIFIAFTCLALASFDAFAQIPPILDPIVSKFSTAQNTWYTSIRAVAEKLFWILVSIDFAWSGVTYVLEKAEVGDIAISVVKKILTIGFFYALLKFSNEWIPAIINSFSQIGITAGGSAGGVQASPDAIAANGFELAFSIFDGIKQMKLMDALGAVIPLTAVAIIILLSFLFVAAQLLVTLIESFIAIGAGVILLGFGGSRWTTDFATKYLQYAVGTGIKLMLIYLIVGLGQTLAVDLVLSKSDLLASSLTAMGTALVFAYLAIQIPSMASAMMSGSPSLTAGALASTALTVGAAVVGGAAAAKQLGGMAGAGASNGMAGAAGMTKALGAGMNAAADMGLTGMAGAAHALGNVGGQALGMAASGIGSAVSGSSGSFQEKVGGSTGGKIASNIEAGRGGSFSGGPQASGANSGASSAGTNAGKNTGAVPGTGAGDGSASSGQSQQSSSANMGNASDAQVSLGAGPQAVDKPKGEALHRKIRDLEGFVPNDASSGGGIQINLNHTQD